MSAVTVTNSATLLVSDNTQRLSLIITNVGNYTIFIGQTASVTISDGIPLFPGASLTEDSSGTKMYLGPFYGITDTNDSEARVWERIR